jgi:hypothetical protein
MLMTTTNQIATTVGQAIEARRTRRKTHTGTSSPCTNEADPALYISQSLLSLYGHSLISLVIGILGFTVAVFALLVHRYRGKYAREEAHPFHRADGALGK